MESDVSTAPASAEAQEQSGHRGFLGAVSDLMLAGIGVVDVLAEGPHALYQHSVERGANRVHRVWDRVPRGRRLRRLPARLRGKGGDSPHMPEEIEATLARMNLPTATDIEVLIQQATELEAKIDQLNRQ